MGQKDRSAAKASNAKDVSPMRNMEINKQAFSSTSATIFGERLTASATTSASSYNNGDKFKYNNMANNQREQFNSLHFC